MEMKPGAFVMTSARLESIQKARFVCRIDDRKEVDEHERRGRNTELAVKRKFLV